MKQAFADFARLPAAPRRARRGFMCVLAASFALTVALAGAVHAQRERSAPEAASGLTQKPLSVATRHMVAAAHPLAAQAGRDILRRGGSAVDAAIATVLVLNLVEPQSSGIGGGGFMLAHDAATGQLHSYDGRETAPASAVPDRFMADGRPMPFMAAVKSGASIGVPGLVRMLELAHRAHGRLPWAALFVPVIELARDGFSVSPRLHALLAHAGASSFAAAARAHYFAADGSPHPVGHVLRNDALAETMIAIAFGGAHAFYRGAIADEIVQAVTGAPRAAGGMTRADLAEYRAVEREPVCFGYRARRICGMGPPSSGGITVAQTLLLLEPFAAVTGAANAMKPDAVHVIAEAEKLAYADRGRYLADPAFVQVPTGLLDEAYLDQRRRFIDVTRAMTKPEPGTPPGASELQPGSDATIERGGTTHISVVDGDGNAVALTATIEGAFGSGVMAAGFLLNNELTDFSFRPLDESGRAIANRVEGGKRPRSSMAPTIVFAADGKVEAVLGSPGGNRIILYVVKALVAMIDWEMDAQQAAALANFGSLGDKLELELDWRLVGTGLRLATRGQRLAVDEMTSGLHIVARRNGRLEGGADPRREGLATGD